MNSRFQKIQKEIEYELSTLEQDILLSHYTHELISKKIYKILQEND
jgi:hypothetical protein